MISDGDMREKRKERKELKKSVIGVRKIGHCSCSNKTFLHNEQYNLKSL